jgi:hypothetical protein
MLDTVLWMNALRVEVDGLEDWLEALDAGRWEEAREREGR